MNDVVDLQRARGAAAGDTAAAAIAPPHKPDRARWDVLVRSLGAGAVERADVLGIAQRTVDRTGVDSDLRARAFLPSALAGRTHGDGDLELRTAGELGRHRAVEDRPAQPRDEAV